MIDDLIDRWQAAWVGRDRAAFAPLCAPDVHYEDPLCGEPLRGPGRARRPRRAAVGGLPRRAHRAHRRAPDRRALRRRARASCWAPTAASSRGCAPTGRFVVVHVVSYCELDPDRERLWRVRAFFDAYDAAVQLGVLPARGTLGERALFMLRGFGLRARG